MKAGSSQPPIPLPAPIVTALETMIAQRTLIVAQIDATIATARACLAVPEDYTISSPAGGFVPPPEYIEYKEPAP